MAIDFNPKTHRIVAVDVDPASPECGNHFHLSLPDLVREAAELPTIDWSPIEQRISAIESKPAAVIPNIDLAPISARMAAIEAAVHELKVIRSATPLVPVSAPTSMPDYGARIEALEHHAAAHTGLSDALRLCLEMARESEARTARLEQEAKDTHRTIATVMPALAAIARR